jgi:hypothetical protein
MNLMFVAPPPPPPTSFRSKHSNTHRKGRSAVPISDYSASLASNDSSYYSYQESRYSNVSPPTDNELTGKGPDGESINKPAKRSFWSALKQSIPAGVDRISTRKSDSLASGQILSIRALTDQKRKGKSTELWSCRRVDSGPPPIFKPVTSW